MPVEAISSRGHAASRIEVGARGPSGLPMARHFSLQARGTIESRQAKCRTISQREHRLLGEQQALNGLHETSRMARRAGDA